MADIRARQEDGVLYLDGLADVALVADGRGAADIAVRADLAVIADDDVALDDDARQDFGAFADLQASVAFACAENSVAQTTSVGIGTAAPRACIFRITACA